MATATALARTRPEILPFKRSWIVKDTLTVARRNLIALFRSPETLVFSTIQPVIFVLLFRYVFGGAVKLPVKVNYVDFLMPGIFVQTVVFGSINTGIGLAEDLRKGLIERFRSLPMARSAVLGGRALADVFRNVFVVFLMFAVGFLVGFRIHTSLLNTILAVVLLLLFGFAMSWLMALIGLSTGTAEGAQAAAFPLMGVLVFASNSFVSTATMPSALAAYVKHQPVSNTVDAVRSLLLGSDTVKALLRPGEAAGAITSTPGRVLIALAWTVGIIAVFAPLAVRRYRKHV